MPEALTSGEIIRVVNRYIGVSGGYLGGDFSYRKHEEFYPEYCDIDGIDPAEHGGTTRERFINILKGAAARDQARILQGLLERWPPGSSAPSGSSADRTEEQALWIRGLVARLEGAAPVESPTPEVSSEVVRRALADAEALLVSSGPTSALDRVHTALHGFLRAACDHGAITYAPDAGVTQLYKALRTEHPALQPSGTLSAERDKIIRSLASVLDALNPIRNRGTLAHPNEELIEEPEALLAINAARTVFTYLDAKIGTPELVP